MPRAVRPKYGHRERPFLGSYGEQLYPPSTVDRLAIKHGISAEQKPALKCFLETAADIYRTHKNNYDDAPRPQHVRAALEGIQKTTASLIKQLTNLDDRSWQSLWQPEAIVSLMAGDDTVERSPYGHTFMRIPQSDDTILISYLRRRDIEQGLSILLAYSETALKRTPKNEGGRPHRQGLYMWVLNAHAFWTRELGRPFRHYPVKGDGGITKAFDFCWAALEPFHADVTKADLAGEMRKVIARSRKRSLAGTRSE